MSKIIIDIETLVLEGFSHSDASKIRQALETELGILFKLQGPMTMPIEGINLERLNMGTINLKPGQNTTRIGQRIAGALFQQLHELSVPAPSPQSSTPS